MPTVVFWGTYDLSKPRARILIDGALKAGIKIIHCRADIWEEIEDKSAAGTPRILAKLIKCLFSYPVLLYQYLRLPKHDAVLVSYPGAFDMLMIRPLALLRGVPVLWDVFIPLYETVVEDRKLISPRSLLARFIYWTEWLACRCSDILFLDTFEHAQYMEKTFHLRPGSVRRVYVGAEKEIFRPLGSPARAKKFTVLFYGQFIPLHGIDIIVDAARILEARGGQIEFVIIGKGQEMPRIESRIQKLSLPNIKRILWVDYPKLPEWIHSADICLGVFGKTQKAPRVIPNKVFQILACRKPLITQDSPAVREIIENQKLLRLIPAGDSEALVQNILDLKNILSSPVRDEAWPAAVDSDLVGRQLLEVLKLLFENTRKGVSSDEKRA